jgi:hypothetical protein
MAEPSLEAIVSLIRQIQHDARETREISREILRHVSNLERLVSDRAVVDADREARIDRLAERMDRIERRLELGDEPTG